MRRSAYVMMHVTTLLLILACHVISCRTFAFLAANEGQRYIHGVTSSRSIMSTMARQAKPLPPWSVNFQADFVPPTDSSIDNDDALSSILKLDLVSQDAATHAVDVKISNVLDETLDFYTFVLLLLQPATDAKDDMTTLLKIDASYIVKVKPKMGVLAPQETQTLHVRLAGSMPRDDKGTLWLLIGTEKQRWVYQIVVSSG